MTLYDLLLDKMADHTGKAIKSFGNSRDVSKHIGASEMCGELINLLSDDTLSVTVITRATAIGEKGHDHI